MNQETYIRAILECNFAGFKEEIIETAVKKIMEYTEAEPIKHGRWGEPNDKGVVSYDKHAYAECSVCHTAEYLARGKRYCPNCGAKMDLKDQYCDRNKCLQMEYNGKGCAECGEVTEEEYDEYYAKHRD